MIAAPPTGLRPGVRVGVLHGCGVGWVLEEVCGLLHALHLLWLAVASAGGCGVFVGLFRLRGRHKKTGECSNLGGGQSFAQHRCHIERVLLTPLRVCVPLVSVSHCDNQCELLAGVAVRRACASSCGGSWFECLCGAGCIPQTAGCVFPHADNRTGSSGCACTSFSSVGVRVCWAALCRVCCSGRVCWIHTLL